MKGIEYRGVTSVDGPIVVLKRTENVFYNETVCVRDRLGEKRTGKVVDISEDAVVVQIFGSTTGLDLDEATFFAAEMGSSASSLYNKLRSITGLNVSAFIRDIRMKEAKRLAQTQPDIRVSDLAYRVGFKDPKYFSTCFKKDFGLQPSEYIEQMAGQ